MKTVRPKIKVKSEVKATIKWPILSTSLQEEILRFMEYHPANRFNRNLRKMLLEFLMQDGAVESLYLDDLLYDLEGLFQLLDAMEMMSEPGFMD